MAVKVAPCQKARGARVGNFVHCWCCGIFARGCVPDDESPDEGVRNKIASSVGTCHLDEVLADFCHEFIRGDGFAVGDDGGENVLKGVSVDIVL